MAELTTAAGPSFELELTAKPLPQAERAAVMTNPGFGSVFTDHMVRVDWDSQSGWDGHRVVANQPISLWPAAAVLHYAQEIFEGLKAYRWDDGSIRTFRPWANAERFGRSAQALALPVLDPAAFVASLEALVQVDGEWTPSGDGTSLYLRPFMFATEPFVGVRPARQVTYLLIASPVGAYFAGGLAPVSIWIDTVHHRAARGGTGAAKCGGNYAASLVSQQLAAANGCDQVLFLDAETESHLEELGGMNVMVVTAAGQVLTPPLDGCILAGITRESIIQLCCERSVEVQEQAIRLDWLLEAAASGEVSEVFACGTAAVITPVGRLAGEGFEIEVGGGEIGPLTLSLYQELTDIQYGRRPDTRGWTHRLA